MRKTHTSQLKLKKIHSKILTPAQAQEALADDAVAQTTSDSHVGLPSFCQHPAERGEEEEVEQGSYKSAHHLRETERLDEKCVYVALLCPRV